MRLIFKKVLKLQKDSIGLQKTQAEIASKNMDTERTYPEVDHLRSETALNMANARKIAQETEINRFIQ